MKSRKNDSKWVYIVRLIFIAIFALNIIGAVYFYAKTGKRDTLNVVILGAVGFSVGTIMGGMKLFSTNKFHYTYSSTIGELKDNSKLQKNAFCCIMILFAISFVFAGTLFVQKGIPLLSSNDNQLRSTFGVGTFGRIRALVTWCPMAGLYAFCLSLLNKRYRKPAWTIIILGFIYLAFYSFKGNLVWFAMMLYLVNTSIKKKIQFGKGVIYAGVAAFAILLIFSVWLSEDLSVAFDYLIKRITQDEVDGLNYMITEYVPTVGFQHGKHFWSQLIGTFFSMYEESFDIQLATLFYGRKVTWGIVQTLYGFLYLDFGYYGVFWGFIIMGIIERKIEVFLSNVEKQTLSSLCFNIYLVYAMIKILLVGNVFNELKGLVLSAIIFNLLYVGIYSMLFTKGRIRRKRCIVSDTTI